MPLFAAFYRKTVSRTFFSVVLNSYSFLCIDRPSPHGGFCRFGSWRHLPAFSRKARMSECRQQVVRSPSLTGWGNFPCRHHNQSVDREIGTSRRTCGSRSSPAGEGLFCIVTTSLSIVVGQSIARCSKWDKR